ncbi:hypothetical protein [Azospira sp.]|jgi:hypothetical protein|uniref:hypothetical protein n=1 Tax=Azospira sp. TaxID=1872671 RepID=UPI00256908F7|nr:hypothetical protein [Azospira sp.]MDK9689620.1 hypothetical protein [Azospira sp.]
MDKRQIAILGLHDAAHEAAYFLDVLLDKFQQQRYRESLNYKGTNEISHMFSAFVRSGKSILELLAAARGERKKSYLEQFAASENFEFLMKTARDAITHGGVDLLAGAIQIDEERGKSWVFICSPIVDEKGDWIQPPFQDGISLSIDYFLAILADVHQCYEMTETFPDEYWHGIREWEIEGMQATVHISPAMVDSAKQAQLSIPAGYVPNLINRDWIEEARRNYQSLRSTLFPTVTVAWGKYLVEYPSYESR